MINELGNIYSLFISAGLDAFEDRNVPSWLSDHPQIKKRQKVKKVFPVFGLPNFVDKVKYKNKSFLEQDQLIARLLHSLSSQIATVSETINGIMLQLPDEADPIKIQILQTYDAFLVNIQENITNADTVRRDGKTKINFAKDTAMAGKIIFKVGDSIFQSFDKINKLTNQLMDKYPELRQNQTVSNTKLPNIDSLPSVKEFNKFNLPNQEYYVVFSGSGDAGAWDIATMSMRGIDSCQNWDDEENRACLVGSVLSKFVGIIYLTSGSKLNEHGTKMIRRCIVRFGINRNTKEKVIILDHMYDSYNAVIADMFMDALTKRTPLKVLDYSSDTLTDSVPIAYDIEIPHERTLDKLSPKEQPYKDLPFLAKNEPRSPSFANKEELKEYLNNGIAYLSFMDTKEKMFVLYKSEERQTIVTVTLNQALNKYINELINHLMKNNVSERLTMKFIKLKMFQHFSRLYNLDIESILKLLFPHQSNWTVDQYVKNLHLTIPQIRDIFEQTVRSYKKHFEALLEAPLS